MRERRFVMRGCSCGPIKTRNTGSSFTHDWCEPCGGINTKTELLGLQRISNTSVLNTAVWLVQCGHQPKCRRKRLAIVSPLTFHLSRMVVSLAVCLDSRPGFVDTVPDHTVVFDYGYSEGAHVWILSTSAGHTKTEAARWWVEIVCLRSPGLCPVRVI